MPDETVSTKNGEAFKTETASVFDRIAEELGGLGRYQITIYMLACIAAFLSGVIAVNIVFLGFINPHRCYVPSCDSSTTGYDEPFVNFTIPYDEEEDEYERCSMFQSVPQHQDLNTSMQCSEPYFDSTAEQECSKWKYDRELFTSTIITSFDLVCDRNYLVPMGGSAYMFGMLVGSFVNGVVADKYGRKVGLIMSTILFGIFGVASALSPNYPMFVVCRAITGAGGIGLFQMAFVIGVELIGTKWRTFCGIMIEVPFALGEASASLLAYFIRDWRWLQVVCTAPGFLLLSYYWLLPESIRWLASKNRMEEAVRVIDRAAKMNKIESPSQILLKSIEEETLHSDEKEVMFKDNSILNLFRAPNIRKKTLILFYSWIVVTMVYYGLSANSGNLSGDIFINYALTMLIEIPGYFITFYLLNTIGRKGTMLLLLELSGLACIISGILPSDMKKLVVSLSLIGKMGVSGAFASIFMYTAELFPTEFRSIGVGSCSTLARVGGILAPIVASLSMIYQPLPLLIFGILSFIAGTTFFFLPETLGKDLPQTLEESEKFGMDQSLWYFPCFQRSSEPSSETSLESEETRM